MKEILACFSTTEDKLNKSTYPNSKKDDVFMLLEDIESPDSCSLGRIVEVHHGKNAFVQSKQKVYHSWTRHSCDSSGKKFHLLEVKD